MKKCKISVLKCSFNEDLAKEYCGREATPCQLFEVGQEFIVEGLNQPADFECGGAWQDIHKSLLSIGFDAHLFPGWMKDDKTIISCCTDGIRPVIFKIERLDD